MHLVRRYGHRVKTPTRIYLYIRRRNACGYLGPDIPLGRIDTGEPLRIVESWLRDSENLPLELKWLNYDEVLCLYEAIQTGESWYRLENAWNPPARDAACYRPWKNNAI